MCKIITTAKLGRLSEQSLWDLLDQTYEQLIRSEPESANRRNALASIENIQRALGRIGQYVQQA